ncbi:MAG: universal stress protein [Bacteroidota bacterium]
MRAVQTIVFPTDFSDAALNAFRYALRLSDLLDARLSLIHVVSPEYETLDLPVIAHKATQDKLDLAKTAMESFVDWGLAQIQLNHSLKRIPVIVSEVKIGNPSSLITNYAVDQGADLIIMGRRNEHNLIEKAFGSTTTHVIEQSSVPVWVIPQLAKFDFPNKIAYASDGNEYEFFNLIKVESWLHQFNPEFHMVHVSNEGAERGDVRAVKTLINEQYPDLSVAFHTIENDTVSDGLTHFTDWNDIDLLVMFAPHHNLLSKLLHKSQSKKVAMKSNIPVLVLKEFR